MIYLTSAEDRKSLWATIYRRKGDNRSSIRVFEDLEEGQKKRLLETAGEMQSGELPVVGGIQNAGCWFLLTSERLIWAVDGEKRNISIESIDYVRPDPKQWRPNWHKEMTRLYVFTKDGQSLPIDLEPGLPLSGVWQIFVNIARRNNEEGEKGLL